MPDRLVPDSSAAAGNNSSSNFRHICILSHCILFCFTPPAVFSWLHCYRSSGPKNCWLSRQLNGMRYGRTSSMWGAARRQNFNEISPGDERQATAAMGESWGDGATASGPRLDSVSANSDPSIFLGWLVVGGWLVRISFSLQLGLVSRRLRSNTYDT